jgi:hypothetical protein
MRKHLGFATAALLVATTSAKADQVTVVFSETGFNTFALSGDPANGTFTTPFGGLPFGTFLIDVSASARPTLPAPGVLDNNVLSIQSLNSTTSNTLTINIGERGADSFDAFGPNLLTSAFDSVGLTPGWTATAQTFINLSLIPVHEATFTGTGAQLLGRRWSISGSISGSVQSNRSGRYTRSRRRPGPETPISAQTSP